MAFLTFGPHKGGFERPNLLNQRLILLKRESALETGAPVPWDF